MGHVALCFVACRCVVLRSIVFGRVVSYGCVVVLCHGVFCFLLCGVGWCRVVSGGVVSYRAVCCCLAVRCVVYYFVFLCGVVWLLFGLWCSLCCDVVLRRLLLFCVALRRVV